MSYPRIRSGRLGFVRLAVAAVLVAFAAMPAQADPALGSVRGAVQFPLAGTSVSDLGAVVVYLEPLDPLDSNLPEREQLVVHQRNARFSPSFAAVGVGETVSLQNDDEIYHNVFSYSSGNEFDLGTYPAGDARSVTLESPGAVRIYCSIHENMNGTIFVAPSRWFARASPAGTFAIEDVPPGEYTLTVWCEKLPDVRRDVVVVGGQVTRVDVPLADVNAADP